MTLTHSEFLALLRKRVKAEGSLRKMAAQCGLSAAFLSSVMRGTKLPGPRLLEKMGFEALTVYREAKPRDTVPQTEE